MGWGTESLHDGALCQPLSGIAAETRLLADIRSLSHRTVRQGHQCRHVVNDADCCADQEVDADFVWEVPDLVFLVGIEVEVTRVEVQIDDLLGLPPGAGADPTPLIAQVSPLSPDPELLLEIC